MYNYFIKKFLPRSCRAVHRAVWWCWICASVLGRSKSPGKSLFHWSSKFASAPGVQNNILNMHEIRLGWSLNFLGHRTHSLHTRINFTIQKQNTSFSLHIAQQLEWVDGDVLGHSVFGLGDLGAEERVEFGLVFRGDWMCELNCFDHDFMNLTVDNMRIISLWHKLYVKRTPKLGCVELFQVGVHGEPFLLLLGEASKVFLQDGFHMGRHSGVAKWF